MSGQLYGFRAYGFKKILSLECPANVLQIMRASSIDAELLLGN